MSSGVVTNRMTRTGPLQRAHTEAELGEFILYEITPLDQPQAIDFLRL